MSNTTIMQQIEGQQPQLEQPQLEQPQQPTIEQQPKGIDLSFLKAETGQGDIQEYIEHPLNFNKSKSVARILRGATGLFGNLNFALADIFIGLLEFSKDRKGA